MKRSLTKNKKNMDEKKMLKIYLIFNIIVLLVLGYLWNVASKLVFYSLISPNAWLGFLIVCLVIFAIQRTSQKKNGEFTLHEAFITMIGSFVPYFAIFIIFLSSSTGLTDKCIINTYIDEIVHIKSYYTQNSDSIPKCNVYHAPSWTIRTKTGHSINISSDEYQKIKKHFGTPEILVSNRQLGQCSGDGRKFKVVWSGNKSTRIPCSYSVFYINYVKATESIYKNTGQQQFEVYDYPQIHTTKFGNIGFMRVIGDNSYDLNWIFKVDSLLDQELTWLGEKRQCNIIVYLTKNPQSFYGSIKEKWINGKKNDIIIIISGELENPDWVRIMNWSKSSNFEINLRDKIMNSQFLTDPHKFVNMVVSTVDDPINGFERKPMEEFRYLLTEVHLKWWAWVLVFSLIGVVVSPLIFYMFRN